MTRRLVRILNYIVPPAITYAGRLVVDRIRRLVVQRRLRRHTMLHLGCGPNILPDWANLDLAGGPGAISIDLSRPIPGMDGKMKFIYSEHFLEHLSQEQGHAFLRECCRVLAPDGVLRLSTPDLEYLVAAYIAGRTDEWADMGWEPETRCQLLNEGMRAWGHEYVYDEKELAGALKQAGFKRIKRVKWRQSQHDVLCDLETRPDHNDLIIEATVD